MFKFDEIHSLFNCPLCKTTFKDPVTLLCGKTVCKVHCEQITKEKCRFCNKNHSKPEDGFNVNEVIRSQLELQVNKININFTQFNEYKKILEELDKGFKEIERIRNNPESFTNDFFNELTRQVDLRRETLIEDIHDYSKKVIENINKLKEECLENSKTSSKIKENIDEIKDKLNNLKVFLEMDDKEHEEIMSQKQLDEVQKMIELRLKEYKLELHQKFYKLVTNEIKFDIFFGSITGYDFEVEKIKVCLLG